MTPLPILPILGSVAAISILSLVGIFLLGIRERLLQRMLFVLISFSTGALLGDVFLHMLPEMTEEGFTSQIAGMILLGILASFVLEKFIHWRHCHSVHCENHMHPVGVMNIVGDALHNAIDGILIAGSYLISIPVGVSTTIAVFMHEIPQEISDFGVLLYSGFSRKNALLCNFLTSLAALAGAVLVLLLRESIPSLTQVLLPLTAGNFLYIAGSDLIPELHKETGARSSLFQLLSMVAGIALMALLTTLE